MEEVMRVSIGGVPFTLSPIAFQKMKAYLDSITRHYEKRPDGREIISDIESRIAELLLEKNSKEEVVTSDKVEEVISVMGNPSQFGDEEEENSSSGSSSAQGPSFQAQQPNPAPVRRRLYRDISDRMIGGVCSGLGHYFKFEPSILRIILAVVLVLHLVGARLFFPLALTHVSSPVFNLIVLAYIILWIVVPAARTYSQKCQMMGTDPGVRGAEESVNNPQQFRGSGFGRVLKILAGLLFIGLGILFVFMIWMILLGSDALVGVNPVNALNLIDVNPWGRVLYKVLVTCSLILPCIAMFYVGIWWLFNLKKPRFRLGWILFLLWVLSLIGLVLFMGSRAIRLGNVENSTASKSFGKLYDTLKVEYAPLPETIDGQSVTWERMSDRMARRTKRRIGGYVTWNGRPFNDDEDERIVSDDDPFRGGVYMYITTESGKGKAYAIYPTLDVIHKSSSIIVDDSTSVTGTSIVKDTTVRADLEVVASRISAIVAIGEESSGKEDKALVEVKDSLLVLHPIIISKKQKFDGTYLSTKLYLPDSSVVIINSPK
ncbi:MAG: PspC domain-containing protein [Bacteroidales bacterium]|nr:PspC domain-containing protein [Bacteroidales bacterium]